eukprot:COSAG01_NODE_50949_length_359_cov_0.196154_2_plen_88_part_01
MKQMSSEVIENTLMAVMIEMIYDHFEATSDILCIYEASKYRETDRKYLKEFMDKVCMHVNERVLHPDLWRIIYDDPEWEGKSDICDTE